MQRARALTYQSMTHGMHQGMGSCCCLSLPGKKDSVVEGGWLNNLSACPGSCQRWISSREMAHGT